MHEVGNKIECNMYISFREDSSREKAKFQSMALVAQENSGLTFS